MKSPLLATGLLALLSSAPALAQCESAEIQGSMAQPFDYFGKSVNTDGATIVVGAFSAGNERPGAAYVFAQDNGMWIETAMLTPSDGGAGDEFGNSVGISGDVIVVGAEYNDNDVGNNAGTAYIFELQGGVWLETTKLRALDASQGQHFGEYVATSNGVVLIGARQDADLGNNSGAAYVFEKIAGAWTQTGKLIGSDGERNDLSGDTVAIQGDRIVMASYRNDASAGNSGAAYVFERTPAGWSETGKLVANDAAGEMGRGVALDGDRIVLGARKDNTQGSESGAGYVFELLNGEWIQTAKLLPSAAGDGVWVGESVAIQGDRILLSAHHQSQKGFNSGAGYVFELIDGDWVETKLLESTSLRPLDEFSYAVSMAGDIAVLTSPFREMSTGVAHVFSLAGDCGGGGGLEPGSALPYGEDVGGSNIGTLSTVSVPTIGGTMELEIANIPNGTSGVLWISLTQTALPAFGGTILSDRGSAPVKLRFKLVSGSTTLGWEIPAGVLGKTLYMQAAAFDGTQPAGLALTNGLAVSPGE